MNEDTDHGARWNPRYVAYANSHGLTPEGMRAKDTERFPGGKMVGFMFWIREHLEMWDREQGHDRARRDMRSEADHVAFTAWLLAKYPTPSAPAVGDQLKLF